MKLCPVGRANDRSAFERDREGYLYRSISGSAQTARTAVGYKLGRFLIT